MVTRVSIVERAVWWFLMCWVWVIWTAGCGAMLVLQDKKMNERPALAIETCNESASRAVPAAHEAPPGPELEHGTRGLRSEYLASSPARAVYAYCLENRDRWPARPGGAVQ
ncbi:MAG TPA: hypothetical protein VMR86_21140 [Myxococcota bacterium]|nr:hypothetical protein [Myxococcota bacterium]